MKISKEIWLRNFCVFNIEYTLNMVMKFLCVYYKIYFKYYTLTYYKKYGYWY